MYSSDSRLIPLRKTVKLAVLIISKVLNKVMDPRAPQTSEYLASRKEE
jgi:hypothetical protein